MLLFNRPTLNIYFTAVIGYVYLNQVNGLIEISLIGYLHF